MTIVILQIVAGLVALISLWAKEYQNPANVAKRAEEARNDEIQKGRSELVAGDVAAVTARLGRVLDKADSGDAGSESGEVDPRPDITALRLAALGISVDKTY